MSHTCPGPDCTKQVPDAMLMCSGHWYRVPRELRNAVWAAWSEGAGKGSEAHARACREAIESLVPPKTPDELAARRAAREASLDRRPSTGRYGES